MVAPLALLMVLAGDIAVRAENRSAAAESRDADALISRGLDLRQAGRDREALPLFQEAAEKRKTPRAVGQVGLCEYALGLWVDAEAHVEEALASKTDPWIRKNEGTLKQALEGIKAKIGALDVWGEPAGALVSLDGKPVGKLPLTQPLRAEVGRHSVVVEAAGYLATSRFVDVSSRELTRQHVALAPVPLLAQPEAAEETSSSVAKAHGTKLSGEPLHGEEDAPPFYKRWWFWTAVGVVALAAGGTALVLSRRSSCDTSQGNQCVTW